MPKRSLLLLILFCLWGCGGSESPTGSSPAPAPAQPRLVGRVSEHPPVVGSPFEVQDDQGRVLASGNILQGGAFSVPASDFPAAFSVVVEVAPDRHYAIRVENFAVGRDAVLINIPTTLARAARQAHPEWSQAEANERTAAFLGLPAGIDLGGHGSNPEFGFDSRDFNEQVQGGSFDAQIQDLASLQAPQALGADVPDGESGFSLTSAGTGLASGLGKGLFNYVASAAIGWAFTEMGIPLGNTASLIEIQNQLTAIKQELDQINTELGTILTAIQNSLTAELKQSLADSLSFIDTNSGVMESADSNFADVSNALKNVLARTEIIGEISNAQLGTNGGPGLIQQTIDRTGDGGRFINSDNDATLQKELQYYQNYQLRALNLLVEACHQADPMLLGTASNALDQFHRSCKQQQQLLPQRTVYADQGVEVVHLDPNVLIDLKSGLMWFRPVQGAMDYPSALLLAGESHDGYSGWRLPTRDEVLALRQASVFQVHSEADEENYLKNQVGLTGLGDTRVWTSDAEFDFALGVRLADGDVELEPTGGYYDPAYESVLLVRELDFPPVELLVVPVTEAPGQFGFKCVQKHYQLVDNIEIVYYEEDVTKRALWSLTTTNCAATISNGPDDAGVLRVSDKQAGARITVTATVPYGPQTSADFLLSSDPTEAIFAPPDPDPSIASLLVSPANKRLSPLDTEFALTVFAAKGSGGTLQNPAGTTFTSDRPDLLSIAANGKVTVLGPSPGTTAKITATNNGVKGYATVIFP